MVHKETEGMQVVRREAEKLFIDGDTNYKATCYRCGKQGHSTTHCKFKTAKSHECQKTGRLATVCLSQHKYDTSRSQKADRNRGNPVHQLQDDDSSSSSSAKGHLHTIFQLGKALTSF